MKAYIVYPTYKIKGDKAYILLYGRLENGENFVTINSYKPYFYIKNSDLKKALKLEKFEYEETKLKTKEQESVSKIILNIPSEVSKLRKTLQDSNIQCYEADIRFATRFLIDKGIQGSMSIEGDYTSEGEIERVYKEPYLTPIEWTPKLKVLSIDIETDSKAKDLYCISLYTDDYKKVLIHSKNKLKNAESFATEEDLLNAFVDKIKQLDPDIITGWALIDFDLKIILEKLKEYKIPTQLGRDNSNCKLRIESNFMRESKADFPGRQVIDAMHILKSSFIKLSDFKLNTAAKEFLNDEKLITEAEEESKGEIIERLYKQEPQKLVDYNLKDAELVIRILEKTKTLDLTIKRSLVTGMPLDRVSASIASLDSLYLKKSKARGYVLPSAKFDTEADTGIGGFVMDSKPGIYENVLVFDFKSLYPSVIKTFNIDPLTITESKHAYSSPAKINFEKEIGILPEIIHMLWQEREEFRRKKDETGRFAIKILMNSFYGAVASPLSRYFNRKLGNAITLNAQFFVKDVARFLEEKGYIAIYGDTDSCFMVSKTNSLKQAQELGEKLAKEINEYYKKWIKKEFSRDSYLELEFEKVYTKFLMPRLRHEEKGAKKRYAGLKNGKEVEVVGLESVRSDWTELAKEYQREILDRVFHDKDVVDYTKKLIQEVKKGKYDDKLIYRKSIRKDVAEYTKTTPPHVKAIRKLKNFRGSRIEYVLTIDGPEPIQQIKHKLDYDHYIEKQIKPIAESILSLYGKTFEEVEKGHKQSSLTDF